MQQEDVQEPNRFRRDADGAERVEVHGAHLDVLHAALAQCVQRPLARPDHALWADRAVELVLDLQQAGGELAIVVAVADADRLVRGIGSRERVLERGRVAREIVVAHGERVLRVAQVAQAPHAQRRGTGQVQGAGRKLASSCARPSTKLAHTAGEAPKR